MLNSWFRFLRRPYVWISLLLAVLFDFTTWLVLFRNLRLSFNEGLIVLHYSLYYGVDLVGTAGEAFFIPVFGLFLIIVNFAFAFYFIERTKIVSLFFLILTPVFESILLAAAIFLVIANLPVTI